MNRKTDVLAVSSGGGHWEQMVILCSGLKGCNIRYATTIEGLGERSGFQNVDLLPDCNLRRPFASIWCAFKVFLLVAKIRPRYVLSTGAAPGLFALVCGRLVGSTCIWVDSVANSEKLSLSGRIAGRVAQVWLTQWEHLSRPSGPLYVGSVL
jgi:UDP-N-acetylglucosamine:LPS N-acetylglucosamine transferase